MPYLCIFTTVVVFLKGNRGLWEPTSSAVYDVCLMYECALHFWQRSRMHKAVPRDTHWPGDMQADNALLS